MISRVRFSVPDYAVFGGMLLISACIGVYHAIVGGGQQSTRQFLMAGKTMSFLPVALSVLASFFSASTLLGTPAEIYQFGTMYWISIFSAMMAPVTGALLFGPMFFKLKVVSVFEDSEEENEDEDILELIQRTEDKLKLPKRCSKKTLPGVITVLDYLEMRFQSKTTRLFGAFIFLLRTVLHGNYSGFVWFYPILYATQTLGMGIVLYGPSTALSAAIRLARFRKILMFMQTMDSKSLNYIPSSMSSIFYGKFLVGSTWQRFLGDALP